MLECRIHGLDIPKYIFVFLFLFFFLFVLSSQNKLFNTCEAVVFGGNGGVSGVTGRARWQTPTHKSLR